MFPNNELAIIATAAAMVAFNAKIFSSFGSFFLFAISVILFDFVRILLK